MLERDLRRLSLDPKSIDEQRVSKGIKKQNTEAKSKSRRRTRVRLSLPSASSSEDEQGETDIEDAAPVVHSVAPPGVRRSHRQQNKPALAFPWGTAERHIVASGDTHSTLSSLRAMKRLLMMASQRRRMPWCEVAPRTMTQVSKRTCHVSINCPS